MNDMVSMIIRKWIEDLTDKELGILESWIHTEMYFREEEE